MGRPKERTLPHDLDAKRAALGAVLIDAQAFAALADLDPAAFFREAHRRIFRAMRTLYVRGDAIDFVTIRQELVRAGDLEEVGGPAYVAALADGMPRTANVRAYRQIIGTLARARDGIHMLTKTVGLLYDQPDGIVNGLGERHREEWARLLQAAPDGDPALADAVDVTQEGVHMQTTGVPFLIDHMIPDLGALGFLNAYAKVGKSTFGLALGASVAMGRPFLDRETRQRRVLVIAAEDPPEYTAWVARHLQVERGTMSFLRQPLILNEAGLAMVTTTVKNGGFGFVLMSSWQAVIRGLVRDENDNAGMAAMTERVKIATRETGIPWLIDSHAGKGEDQGEDADPSRAVRGASAIAVAADFLLSLRYANGTFSTRRRLSGKGRFVSFEPILMDFDPSTGDYRCLADEGRAMAESTWLMIQRVGVLTTDLLPVSAIAVAIGLVDDDGKATKTGKRQVTQALRNRFGVLMGEISVRGNKTVGFKRDVDIGGHE